MKLQFTMTNIKANSYSMAFHFIFYTILLLPFCFSEAKSLNLENGVLNQAEINSSDQPIIMVPILRIGSRGNDVMIVQSILKKRGYYKYAIDGIYGKYTQKATMKFQADFELEINGVVDSKTKAFLTSDIESKATDPKGKNYIKQSSTIGKTICPPDKRLVTDHSMPNNLGCE